VLVLGHPAAEGTAIADQVLRDQAVDNLLDLRVAQLHYRLAAAFLVAGRRECTERQRVLRRRGDLFLDQAADHAAFGRVEFDAHG